MFFVAFRVYLFWFQYFGLYMLPDRFAVVRIREGGVSSYVDQVLIWSQLIYALVTPSIFKSVSE